MNQIVPYVSPQPSDSLMEKRELVRSTNAGSYSVRPARFIGLFVVLYGWNKGDYLASFLRALILYIKRVRDFAGVLITIALTESVSAHGVFLYF
ncbi:hypothetical protein LIER_34551 [Lithospermum erythrorhizon]|uniref:Uncharacterized protein n=1 Tax=Lithospermum erythrorhizon TaxID=34254 RepID=A0AAV3RZZ8_LITER